MNIFASLLDSMADLCRRFRRATKRARVGLLAFVGWLCVASGNAADLPTSFFDQHCVDCHNEFEANAEIRLDDLEDIDWQVPNTGRRFERVLKAIRSGQMPPEGSSQLTDAGRERAVDSIHSVLMQRSTTGGTVIRRLSREEYEQSIRSIFGIDFELADSFPTDSTAQPFDNTAESLVMSGPLLEAHFRAAINVADRLVPPPAKPVSPTVSGIDADGLVISYSSGAIIDGAMRLAAKTDSMWRSTTWPEQYEVRRAGSYRIRVSASQFSSRSDAWPEFDGPMKLQVRARSLNKGDGEAVTKQRLLAEFDVTEETPETFEFEADLFPAETPVFYFSNAVLDGDRSDKQELAATLRKMFENDPRLLAGWLTVDHGRGLRGGIGWDRVKKLRDAEDLNLSDVDMSEQTVDKLVKKMSSNPGLYAETVVFQFFEEGPALEIHGVDIEGPLRPIPTPEEEKQHAIARRFFGKTENVDNEAYLDRFLERFLTQTFRRPVDDDIKGSYRSLITDHKERGNRLEDGLHLAIRTALMSPHFLYRAHRPQFDEFDLATRLAYFLTSAPPDPSLFNAAKAGELSKPETLRSHVKRLLNSKASGRFVSNFTTQWLELDRLSDISPDPSLFPKFDDIHRQSMLSETEHLFREILEKNLPLETFIEPDFIFLNQALAKDIYGLDVDLALNKRMKRVSLEPSSHYGGLLGQASVMMATANGVDTQPVLRGVWVLENILGDPPPEPPQNVPALTPDTRGTNSVREQLSAHQSEASCASCHRKIDPLGLVLENFDPIGRWRSNYSVQTTDAKGKTVEQPGAAINATVMFPGGVEFTEVNDLKRYVVTNLDQFGICLSEKLLTYATGRTMNYAEKQEIAEIVKGVRKQGNGFRDLLLAIVTSDVFLTK